MTRFRVRNILGSMGSAAVFAAFFCLLPTHSSADTITVQSTDGAVQVTGHYLAHDGEILTLATESGPVSLRSEGVSCTGADCPADGAAPVLRIAAQGRAAQLLVPALIEAYRRDTGNRLDHALWSASAIQAIDGLPETPFDVFLSPRPLSAAELDLAERKGLAALDNARQAQILAMDALVPAVAADHARGSIPLSRLVDAISGNGTVWPDRSASNRLHLLETIGPDLTWLLPESANGPELILHATPESLSDALAAEPDALALVPLSQVGPWRQLALSGPCGLRSTATERSIRTEDYPLTFPVYLYLPPWRPHPDIKAFLDWLRSEAAQLVVRRAGLVDLAGVPIPIDAQGRRFANAIRMAGADVPLGELQRLVRALDAHTRISITFRFDPGSTFLNAPSRSHLLMLAHAIRDGRYSGRDIVLVGFSDGRGPADANRDLAAARAEAVKEDLLAALGGALPFNVGIETDAFGEAMPLACDDSAPGQQANRRVEMWVRDRR